MRYPSYGEDKRSERPVRLDKTEGHIIIEGRTYPAREIVEALAQSGYAEIRSDGDSLVLGRRRITPIFKSSQERAMAALCHGSLAYCCPLSKRCAVRARALEMLGLSKEDYKKMKEEAHHHYIEVAKGLVKSHDPWYEESRHSANRPAVDRGYGGDDYRQDFDAIERMIEERSRQRDGRRHWSSERRDESSTRGESPQFPRREQKSPFTDVDEDGFLTGERKSSVRIRSGMAGGCPVEEEKIDGIGSLFMQGELSPFNEDTEEEPSRFCFSCGRNIRVGTRECPYCGASQ
ncbi:MAG: hypothetical protein BAJATHORv1_10441 [Candidatus Thorarchaeota archaeon]|nr:MAG: hypothetical protein BAJATHORv1_10441 [Candidatus Thorarchaeota archaeon]